MSQSFLVASTEVVSNSEQLSGPRCLMRQIFGAIARYEKAMIVAKLRGARQRMKQREGRCEGRKPYGFREGEAEVIERMKQLRKQDLSYDRIAEMLNAEHLLPRAGQQWHGFAINRISKPCCKALGGILGLFLLRRRPRG